MPQSSQPDLNTSGSKPAKSPRRSGSEANRTAWRRPPGVSTGTWRYAHEGTIASRYDDFVATTPLCRVDLEMVREWFPPVHEGAVRAFKAIETGPTSGSASTTENPAAPKKTSEKKWMLDLGCGTGRASAVLADAGYRVLAIDLSLPMLEQVMQRGIREIHALRVNLVQLDAVADDSAVGAVCLFSTLGMIQGRSNRRQFLTHARRIVRPGGKLLLHVHNRYAALTHSAGRRQLIGSLWSSWRQSDVEFGDAVYPYRGLPDMFLHQFSKRELTADLIASGWTVQRWERLSLDGSQRMQKPGTAGGFLVVVG